MRLLLALFAVLALLVSPVAASAAASDCFAPGAGGMTMPAMAHGDMDMSAGDPCCDDMGKTPMDDQLCALACAVMCGVNAALLPTPASEPVLSGRVTLVAAEMSTPRAHAPPGLDHPPKQFA